MKKSPPPLNKFFYMLKENSDIILDNDSFPLVRVYSQEDVESTISISSSCASESSKKNIVQENSESFKHNISVTIEKCESSVINAVCPSEMYSSNHDNDCCNSHSFESVETNDEILLKGVLNCNEENSYKNGTKNIIKEAMPDEQNSLLIENGSRFASTKLCTRELHSSKFSLSSVLPKHLLGLCSERDVRNSSSEQCINRDDDVSYSLSGILSKNSSPSFKDDYSFNSTGKARSRGESSKSKKYLCLSSEGLSERSCDNYKDVHTPPNSSWQTKSKEAVQYKRYTPPSLETLPKRSLQTLKDDYSPSDSCWKAKSKGKFKKPNRYSLPSSEAICKSDCEKFGDNYFIPDSSLTTKSKAKPNHCKRNSLPSLEVLSERRHQKCKNNYSPNCSWRAKSMQSNRSSLGYSRSGYYSDERNIRIEKAPYDIEDIMKLDHEEFIDTHCHIDFLFRKLKYRNTYKSFQDSRKQCDPYPVSYAGCIAVFCQPHTFSEVDWWTDILKEERVWATFGCHPHFSDNYGSEEREAHLSALKHDRVVAVGEIGLDYSGKNNNCKELQIAIFQQQLSIAKDVKLPVVIHCRDAFKDCITVLRKTLPTDYKIHLHCFTSTLEEAFEWLDTFENLYIGFTCLLTCDSLRARPIKRTVKNIPLSRILLETDSPYFRPKFLPNNSQFSHPGHAIHVAAYIAYLRNIPLENVLKQVRKNTTNMYGI